MWRQGHNHQPSTFDLRPSTRPDVPDHDDELAGAAGASEGHRVYPPEAGPLVDADGPLVESGDRHAEPRRGKLLTRERQPGFHEGQPQAPAGQVRPQPEADVERFLPTVGLLALLGGPDLCGGTEADRK